MKVMNENEKLVYSLVSIFIENVELIPDFYTIFNLKYIFASVLGLILIHKILRKTKIGFKLLNKAIE